MFGKPDKPTMARHTETVRDVSKPNAAPGVKAAQTEAVRATGKESDVRSIISADMKVVGNLQSAGDIQIEGTVEGDINTRTLTVGESANIDGSITAETVRICGSISGQVKATAVRIIKTANVAGDITYQTLSIEEGATFEGNCRRFDAAKPAVEAKVAEIKRAQPEPAAKAAPTAGAASAGAATSGGTGGKPLAR